MTATQDIRSAFASKRAAHMKHVFTWTGLREFARKLDRARVVYGVCGKLAEWRLFCRCFVRSPDSLNACQIAFVTV